MQNRRATKFAKWAALGAAFLAVFGCSNNPQPEGWSQTDTLTTSITQDPTSLDPTFDYFLYDAWVVDSIYPTFFRYHYLKQDPYVLELNLGAEMPVVEPWTMKDEKGKTIQGQRVTFRYKKGLHFQDDPCFPNGKGREIVANDVVYAFKRMADPAIQCPIFSYISDKILGLQAYSDAFPKPDPKDKDDKKDPKHYDDDIPGVQVDPKDPYVLHILLVQPYSQLNYIMNMHFTTPIPKEAIAKYGVDTFAHSHPVGSGAYMLQEYIPHERFVLVANPNNFEQYPNSGAASTPPELLKDAGRRLPLARRLVIQLVREPVTAYNLLQQGYLDAWTLTPSNANLVVHAVNPGSGMRAKGLKVDKRVAPTTAFLGFNMLDSVYGGYSEQRKKLRQAISLSIDSDAYIELAAQGMGVAAHSIMPPTLQGYDPNYRNPYRAYDPSLKKAKQLLTEAGYPGGVDSKTGERLVLNIDNDGVTPEGREQIRLIAKNISALGIQVISRDSDTAMFTEKLNHRQYQMFTYSWIADYPDAENFELLIYGPNASPQPNYALYASPKFDELYRQMRAMPDGPERNKIIAQMRDVVVEDCPLIYLFHSDDVTLSQPWMSNPLDQPVAVDIWKYRGVDPAMRVRLQNEWNNPVNWPLYWFIGLTIVGIVPGIGVLNRRRTRHVRRGEK